MTAAARCEVPVAKSAGSGRVLAMDNVGLRHKVTRRHLVRICLSNYCALALCVVLATTGFAQKAVVSDSFARTFAAPPDDTRPMMRWWWFGPAVVNEELGRELRVMQQAGIGGVEIQPVYPLAPDDPAKGIRNLPYLSPEFLSSVHFANATGRSLGMRVDITLGSGWPYGGPGTTLALAAGRLKLIALPARSGSMTLPPADEGDTLIAAFAVPGTPAKWAAAEAKQLPLAPGAAAVVVPIAGEPATLLLFYASHTRQQVKRPAVGAEGFVLDHFSRQAIDEHLHDVADKLAGAFGPEPPYSVFSDSLEVYGSDWTTNLPAEFERRRGYDLIPHLPELYAGGTEQAAAVRNDWGQTLSDLVRDNYLTPVNDWAREHKTLFRSQTYGEPAVTLADEAVASLPEGEGPQWRQFSFTRWATSASHLYHRPVTSAETFTWLHSPVFTATPLDMKVEADRMFLSGVNQIVGHGWPYTPPSVPDPGWNLYAAAVFDDHNPWFAVMPDVARYMQRASWLLRQGEPANDVAILLPEDDAQADFVPGHVAITDEMMKRITPELTRKILDAGYNLDYIDAATIERLGGIPYPIVVLPPTRRMPLHTARLLAEYVAHGGHIIATGETPTLGPGLQHQGDSAAVSEAMRAVFEAQSAAKVTSLSALPEALHKAPAPDMAASALPDPAAAGNDANAGLGFIHRVIGEAGDTGKKTDIYFVVNSSSATLATSVSFRAQHTLMRSFSLDSGKELSRQAGMAAIALTLAPYESRVFVLSDGTAAQARAATASSSERKLPSLEGGWTIKFPDAAAAPLPEFVAWNTLPGRRFFSGEVVYSKTFDLDSKLESDMSILLEFGEGTPTTDTRRPGAAGIHALLDPPIRDAAIVFVNGKRAGAIWHPPYSVEIGGLLQQGMNTIEVHVYNTAVNSLAGQPPRDYTALNARYGKRFDPQEMDQIRSLPSGLLAAPTLRFADSR